MKKYFIVSILLLSGCVSDHYSVPDGYVLSDSPSEIERQQKQCLNEGIDTMDQHFGFGSVAGAMIGGAIAGPIGGATGGIVSENGQTRSQYLRQYMKYCMTEKGYKYEGTY